MMPNAGRVVASRVVDHESLVIVLSSGGSPLDAECLDSLPGVAIQWVRVEREGGSACLAARVRCADRPEDFRDRMRRWGAARGWAVAVAPCRAPC
jgi:hypothetical protein